MLPIGTQAPDFSCPDDSGETITLSQLLEHGAFVLYFYPADFTPGCTKQACMMRDVHGDLLSAGIRVVGVSRQGASSHQAFREKFHLPFPLLCDPKGSLAALYDAVGLLGVTKRVSYFVTAEGHIGDHEEATFRVSKHARFVERLLAR